MPRCNCSLRWDYNLVVTSKTKLIVGLLGGGAALAAVVFLVILPALVDKVKEDGKARVAQRYTKAEILLQDDLAQSYGLESRGVSQTRGNGTLVLTTSTLHFFQFSPDQEIEIPVSKITETKIVRSHLGKTAGVDLLHVTFSTAAGTPDSIAWVVRPSAMTWKATLDERKAGAGR